LERLIEGVDYFVRYIRLPPKAWAFVTPNNDGTFSVYLDPRRSKWQQKCDFDHEIQHILCDDFYNGKPIQEVEAR
jgi:hypothetical protein